MNQPGDDRLLRSWDGRVAEDAFEDGDAATDDDVIRDVLHDGGGLSSDEGQQNGSLVQVPEQEKLASAEKQKFVICESRFEVEPHSRDADSS